MVPKASKICKQAAAGIMRGIPLTFPETLEISRMPGNAICQSHIMAAYKIGLLTIYGIKKQKKKLYL